MHDSSMFLHAGFCCESFELRNANSVDVEYRMICFGTCCCWKISLLDASSIKKKLRNHLCDNFIAKNTCLPDLRPVSTRSFSHTHSKSKEFVQQPRMTSFIRDDFFSYTSRYIASMYVQAIFTFKKEQINYTARSTRQLKKLRDTPQGNIM
jgi:hypothetical protein